MLPSYIYSCSLHKMQGLGCALWVCAGVAGLVNEVAAGELGVHAFFRSSNLLPLRQHTCVQTLLPLEKVLKAPRWLYFTLYTQHPILAHKHAFYKHARRCCLWRRF